MSALITNIFAYVLLGIYIFSVLSTIVVLVMENRNPIRSIAWISALIFLPGLGLLFYLMFGQNFRQKKKINKLSLQSIEKNNIEHPKFLDNLPKGSLEEQLTHLLFQNSEAIAYLNSDIKLYTNGKETFDAIFKDLEQANCHIHTEFYIIENDTTAQMFKDILIKKAKQGVEVRLIYDYWGSYYLPKKYFKEMKDAGISFHAFFPPKFPFVLSKLNYRNHRKLIVIDGKIAYCGGVNIADRYRIGDELGAWRDTMIRVEGNAAQGLQDAFLADWYFVDRKLLSDKKYFPNCEEIGRNRIQIVDSGPNTQWMGIMQGIYQMISSCHNYIYIQTPYFMPTQLIVTALQTAALRGIDVRLMIPSQSDTSMAKASNSSYIEQMLDAGVKVYRYMPGFLHSKTLVADDSVSSVGTANMDFRSFEQNFEINAFVYSTDFALELKNQFIADLNSCETLDKKSWKRRPRIQKIKESFARLLSPLM